MATFRGGPCDGQDVGFNLDATLSCGGITYTRGAGGDYFPASGGSGAVGTAAAGTHASKGWADLQKSVNRNLPTALVRSQKFRRATLRTIARRRRVR